MSDVPFAIIPSPIIPKFRRKRRAGTRTGAWARDLKRDGFEQVYIKREGNKLIIHRGLKQEVLVILPPAI